MMVWKIIWLYMLIWSTSAYQLWIYSFDDDVSWIQSFVAQTEIRPHVIWVIYDGYGAFAKKSLRNLVQRYGTGISYHITLSPYHGTARMVAAGVFDEMYQEFFDDVHSLNITVYMRTMHEMNGGRYPRWWDPVWYQTARKGVYLMKPKNVSMVFSFNIHDMPTLWRQSQSAYLISCTPNKKCLRREDYRPWDIYVDYVWFSVYNRWKATSDRKRLSAQSIITDPVRNQRSRIMAKRKKIIIDEIATTAVRYNGAYTPAISKALYQSQTKQKNRWLSDLSVRASSHPIHLMMYFNKDKTNQLNTPTPGEADRPVYNPINWKLYTWIYDVYTRSRIDW